MIGRLLNHTCVEHVLVAAGPGLSGEGRVLLKSRFQGETSKYLSHIQFPANQEEYVDIRTVLQHALP